MTKEIYISSTPHETRLALVEDDNLAEIYYERENEYTLAGSIYKGRVTRVLPGMQSAFVDVGLERDAFLYVTDFVEENEDGEEYVALPQGQTQQEGARSGRRNDRQNDHQSDSRGGDSRTHTQPSTLQDSSDEGDADISLEQREQRGDPGGQSDQGQGVRRWRGRRGRRRSGNDRNTARSGDQTSAAGGGDKDHSDAALPTDTLPGETIVSDTEATHERRSQSRSSRDRAPSERRTSDSPRESRDTYDATPHATPLILPGESLSKYRRNDEPARASSSTPPTSHSSASPTTSSYSSRPSTLVEAPLAWDGGMQLPGESLSRYRHTAQEKTPDIHPAQEAASAETAAPVEAAPVMVETAPAVADAVTEAPTSPVAPEPTPTEYEPAEASASYLVDPTAPSAYRRGSVAEPEEAPENVAEQPAVPAPMEQSVAPAITDTPATHTQEVETQASDEEIPSSTFSEESPEASDDEDFDDDSSETTLHAFAPGTGILEEELIDEEEDDNPASYALLDDNELDELVEETLDVQMDSGLLSDMVRDAHLEERTRFNSDQNGQVANEADTSSDGMDEEDDLSEDDDFSPDDSEESEDTMDDGPADSVGEEPTGDEASQNGAARPERPRFSGRGGRGRQNNRRRSGGHSGGHGRRATAQTTNMPAINDLLKSGQEILVQIAKEPIARKGARITSHIALPGRFLVFMPTVNHVGVSRKISSDEERQRLKRILISEKGDAGGGFIVRTAAATASEDDLRADIRFLLNLWTDIRTRSEASKPPALIYHDLSLVERVLRDQVSENFSTIWVDTEADYERVLRFLQRFQPSLVRRVKLYTKETPLFDQFGIQDEINKALLSKVWLKSGGSIVINQTEALVAIDINTGKYVGKTARLEDTILKTNLDAIPEIVRQIRLRDLGGIIVIDFIDMDERKNRYKVMQALEEELHSDRAPSKVLQFNDFGLVAITRKRVKQSLERTLSTQCTICTGTGMVKSTVTVCNEIYIELRKMHRHLDKGDIMLRVHPEVVKQLKSANARWLGEMEELSGKTIIVKSDPSLHPEQFDIH